MWMFLWIKRKRNDYKLKFKLKKYFLILKEIQILTLIEVIITNFKFNKKLEIE